MAERKSPSITELPDHLAKSVWPKSFDQSSLAFGLSTLVKLLWPKFFGLWPREVGQSRVATVLWPMAERKRPSIKLFWPSSLIIWPNQFDQSLLTNVLWPLAFRLWSNFFGQGSLASGQGRLAKVVLPQSFGLWPKEKALRSPSSLIIWPNQFGQSLLTKVLWPLAFRLWSNFFGQSSLASGQGRLAKVVWPQSFGLWPKENVLRSNCFGRAP